MSIWGRVNNAVEAYVMPEVMADGLISESRTALILKARAENVMGPAGNDIEMTWQNEIARGRSYRGAPEKGQVVDTGEPVSSRALWSGFEADIVIQGDEIVKSTGMTTKQIMEKEVTDMVGGERDMMRVYNISEEAVKGAAQRVKIQVSKSLWENPLPDDRPDFTPEGLPTLFDETVEWHGMEPGELGNWQDGKAYNPWGSTGPPNVLTGDAHYYRHVPQVFDANDSHISYDVLHEPNVAMSASIPGYWICPLHYKQFTKLTRKAEGSDKIPLTVGYGMWRKSETVLLYDRTFYYADNEAPEDEAWHIHIGDAGGMNSTRGAGFKMVQWVPPNAEEILSEMPPPDPFTETGYNLGYNTTLPVWTDEYDRAQGQTDTIYSEMRYLFSYCGGYRWKNYKVRNLNTGSISA